MNFDDDDERPKISEETQKLILEQLCARTPIRVFFRKLPVVPIPKTEEEKYKVDIPIDKLSTERPKPLSYDNVPLYAIIHTWSIYTEPATKNSKYPKKRLFPFIEFPPRESYIVDRPSICIHPSTVSKMMYYVYNCIYSKNNCYKVKSICTSGFKNLYVETWPGCPQKDRTLLIDIITAGVTNLTESMDESALAKVSTWIPDPALAKYTLSIKELQELSPDEKPRRRPTGKRTNRSFGAISGELSTVQTDARILPQESKESLKDKEISEKRKLALIEARKNIVQCCHPEHTGNTSWCIKLNSFVCPLTEATICKRHLDEVVDSLLENLSDTGFPKHRWFPVCPIYYLIQNKEKDFKVYQESNNIDNKAFSLVQQHKPHRLNISFGQLIHGECAEGGEGGEQNSHSLNTLVHPCEYSLVECSSCFFPNRCNQLTILKQDCTPNQIFKDYHYKCVRCNKNQCIRCQKMVQMCTCWGSKCIGSESIDKNLFLSSIADPFEDTQTDEKVFEFLVKYADEQPVGHLRMLAMFSVRLTLAITSLYLRCKNNVCSKCASKVIDDEYDCAKCVDNNHITCLNCGTHLNKNVVEGESFNYQHNCFGFLPIISRALDDFRFNQQNSFSFLINQFDNLSSRRFLGLIVSIITKFLRHRIFLLNNRSIGGGYRKVLLVDQNLLIQAFGKHPWWDDNMSNFIQRTWALCEESLQIISN